MKRNERRQKLLESYRPTFTPEITELAKSIHE